MESRYPFLALVAAALLGVSMPRPGTAEPASMAVRFEHIGHGTALDAAQVSCIYQDRRGFLWFGTRDSGLFRFDGYRVKRYVHDPNDAASLSGNRVWAIAEEPGGRLWIGTFGDGLDRLDPASDRFERFRHDPKDETSLANDRISALLYDSAGTLWVGTFGGGLDRLAPGTESRPRFLHLRHDPNDPTSLANDQIWTLLEDRGRLWIGLRYNGIDHVPVAEARAPAARFQHLRLDSDQVWAMGRGTDGSLWAGMFGGGLVKVDARTGESTRVVFEGSDDQPRIRSVFQDSQGIVWAATNFDGLRRIDPARGTVSRLAHREDDPASLTSDQVTAIFEDAEGVLWFGTWGGGVCKLDPRTARFGLHRHHGDDPRGLGSSLIRAILQDSAGRLWVGTDKGLDVAATWDRAAPPVFTRYQAKDGLRDERISSLFEDRGGQLWVASWYGGLYVVERREGQDPKFVRFQDLPDHPLSALRDRVTAMVQDRHGVYWLGTRNKGVFRWDGTRLTGYEHSDADPASLSYDVVWTVFADSSGTVWVGTEEGLDRFDEKLSRFERFGREEGSAGRLSGTAVSSIAEDSRGNLWIGTRNGGLNQLDRKSGKVRSFREKDGLSSDLIARVLVDARDRVWLATNRGLDRLDPTSGLVTHFDEHDGLQSDSFFGEVDGAGFKAKDGRLYFGGPRGFNVFDPERIDASPRVPPVVLTDFLLFNRRVPISASGPLTRAPSALEDLTLGHADDLFAFEFSALSYRRPEKNRYAYRLEGFDKGWIDTSATDRKAVYTRVPPGSYTFRVRASNDDGLWNDAGAALRVVILPPWWRTWWFKALLGLLFVVSPLAWLRQRTVRLERHQRELEDQVAARTRELVLKNSTIEDQARQLESQNDVLRENARLQSDVERMSRHDLKTPLASIISIPKLLLRRPGLAEGDAELLKLIESSGYRVLNMVNLSLDLYRMEKGTYAFQPKAVDVLEVLKRVTLDLGSQAASKRVSFQLERGGDTVGPILASAEELLSYSMLANVIKNALEAAPERSAVTIRVGKSTDEVSIRVHNAGEVPEAIRGRFFEKYASAGKASGTGLGTYSAKLMAETQRGRISMTTSESEGTAVTVVLERAPEGSTPTGEMSVPGATPARVADELAELRVLIVDDEPGNIAVLRRLLPSPPLEVDVAVNGRAALERFESFRPDVVFMDVAMPIMDGLEATARIRALEAGEPARAACFIVGFSSYDDPETRERVLAAGCDRFLHKPAERELILKALRDATGSTEGPAPPPDESAPSDLAGRLPGIDVESAIRRFGGNEKLLVEMVGDLRRRFLDAPARIRAAVAKGDSKGAEAIAHALRGVAANLSATAVARCARDVESTLHEGGDAAASVADLDAALGALPPIGVDASAALPTARTGTAASIASGLQELTERLASGRLDALEELERVKGLLEGMGVDDVVRDLERQVANLEFGPALDTLAAMRAELRNQEAS